MDDKSEFETAGRCANIRDDGWTRKGVDVFVVRTRWVREAHAFQNPYHRWLPGGSVQHVKKGRHKVRQVSKGKGKEMWYVRVRAMGQRGGGDCERVVDEVGTTPRGSFKYASPEKQGVGCTLIFVGFMIMRAVLFWRPA
ncbi:hypothetical protein L210DRAFT_932408 [Boletus edulis BED1]|uniref:Uncharacterized protein n=1 Tax=Boletus edulis BED1 TaxID=1328754 RepID=A0AAD4BQU9_BOLED|nr:hypothetical protein L210DRAFT_932408 [Boletus edulis BED1]